MDIVGVSWHFSRPQDSPARHSCSYGLHREVGLNHDHVGSGAGLGEILQRRSLGWLIAALQVIVIAGNGANEPTLHGMQGTSLSALLGKTYTDGD